MTTKQQIEQMQAVLDRGHQPDSRWMPFVYPVNNAGQVRWIVNHEAVAERMWLKANGMGRMAHLEVV